MPNCTQAPQGNSADPWTEAPDIGGAEPAVHPGDAVVVCGVGTQHNLEYVGIPHRWKLIIILPSGSALLPLCLTDISLQSRTLSRLRYPFRPL
jgi:hypothetical protein